MEPKLDILPSSQGSLWPQLGLIPKKFVLYGGTAIAAAIAVYRNKFNPQITLREAVSFVDGDLPSLSRSDRQILENAVTYFWLSKLEPPATAADSTNLSPEK